MKEIKMAIDQDGNGLTYIGDEYGVSLYQLKLQNLDVLQVGARLEDGAHVMIRKNVNDQWMHTAAPVAKVADGSRVSGGYIHSFVAHNLQKILVDLYVIPQLTSQVDVPDFPPSE